MIKSLVAAIALTIGLAGYAVAQEAVHRHHNRQRHQMVQPGPSLDTSNPSAQWSYGGGFSCFNPVKCAQTSGIACNAPDDGAPDGGRLRRVLTWAALTATADRSLTAPDFSGGPLSSRRTRALRPFHLSRRA